MKIEEITVSAGRTLQHPTQSYANVRPSLSLRARLDDGDDPIESIRRLQLQAEQLVEEHAAALIASIEEREVADRELHDIERLTHSIVTTQDTLRKLKDKRDERQKTFTSFLPSIDT